MNIKGSTVTLRAVEARDMDILKELINDADTEYMLGGWSFPVSDEAQHAWFSALTPRADELRTMIDVRGRTAGTAILSDIDYKNGSAQLHIKLRADDFRQKGYGTDAVKALVGYAFKELRLHSVYAAVSDINMPSKKLFEKCGFEKEGVLRQRLYKRGEYIDIIMYSVINDAKA